MSDYEEMTEAETDEVNRQFRDADTVAETPTARQLAAWRALPPEVQTAIRKAVIVERVAASMAQEGQPVSAEWIESARARRALKP